MTEPITILTVAVLVLGLAFVLHHLWRAMVDNITDEAARDAWRATCVLLDEAYGGGYDHGHLEGYDEGWADGYAGALNDVELGCYSETFEPMLLQDGGLDHQQIARSLTWGGEDGS